jgi:WD40 repeat protein
MEFSFLPFTLFLSAVAVGLLLWQRNQLRGVATTPPPPPAALPATTSSISAAAASLSGAAARPATPHSQRSGSTPSSSPLSHVSFLEQVGDGAYMQHVAKRNASPSTPLSQRSAPGGTAAAAVPPPASPLSLSSLTPEMHMRVSPVEPPAPTPPPPLSPAGSGERRRASPLASAARVAAATAEKWRGVERLHQELEGRTAAASSAASPAAPSPLARRSLSPRTPAPPTRGAVEKLPLAQGVAALAVCAGGALASGGPGHLRVWAGEGGGWRGLPGRAVGLGALPDGRLVAAGGHTQLVDVWDLSTGARVHQLRGHSGDVTCVAVLGGLCSTSFATGGGDSTVRVWDLTVLDKSAGGRGGRGGGRLGGRGADFSGGLVATLRGHCDEVVALAALPGGRLASGSLDASVFIWDVAKECYHSLPHAHCVRALAALRGGALLASGCDDGIVQLWAVPAAGKAVAKGALTGHRSWVRALVELPGGFLASASNDKTVRVWDVGALACVAALGGQGGPVAALAVLLTGGRLAVGALAAGAAAVAAASGTSAAAAAADTAPLRVWTLALGTA